MHAYIGKTCPFCKTGFTAEDEIVVCCDCEMPHHKDCWVENQGCTTFGCTGTIQGVDNVSTSVTSKELSYDDIDNTDNVSSLYCPHCGAQNLQTSVFCIKCGVNLSAIFNSVSNASSVHVSDTPSSPTQTSVPVQISNLQPTLTQHSEYNDFMRRTTVDDDIAYLVGTNAEYYIPTFQNLKRQYKTNSWNWAAFWFAPYWFIYRKMYVHGFAILAAFFILSLIPVLSLFSFAGNLAIGFYGNYLYLCELEKKSAQLKGMVEPLRTQFIQKNGGTESTITTITVVCYAILIGIISL